jgi:uncharacterized membrane protein
MPLKVILGLVPFPVSLSLSLLPSCHEMRSFLHYFLFAMMHCTATGLKAIGPRDHGLKSLKP